MISNFRERFFKYGEVLFFDLEYYVPKENRAVKGLRYNPWDENSLFLGGAFMSLGAKELSKKNLDITSKIETHFLWDYESEKKIVEKFHTTLVEFQATVAKRTKNRLSPVLCGIGILSSDIPVLFHLFRKHDLGTEKELFRLQKSFRLIDLSMLGIYTLVHPFTFLYPKEKKSIINKCYPGKKMESGINVWGLYEAGKYEEIISRVREEIELTHHFYRHILGDLKRLRETARAMEKAKKKKNWN